MSTVAPEQLEVAALQRGSTLFGLPVFFPFKASRRG